MDVQKLSIETEGTPETTIIKVNDEIIACVQELTITVKAQPDNTVTAFIRSYKKQGIDDSLLLEDVRTELNCVYSVYSTQFADLELINEPIQFV